MLYAAANVNTAVFHFYLLNSPALCSRLMSHLWMYCVLVTGLYLYWSKLMIYWKSLKWI